MPVGKTSPTIRIAPADDAILRALARYHYLTTAQVTKLLYKPTVINYVRDRLRRLHHWGIINADTLPSKTAQSPTIYSLAERGKRYLAGIGLDVEGRFYPSDKRIADSPLGLYYIKHTQEVNDFLIALEGHLATQPDVASWTLIHERDMKKAPIRVPQHKPTALEAKPETALLLPDGIVTITYTSGNRRNLFLEVDRGTEEQKKWRKKIRHYLTYYATDYQRTYPDIPITISVVVTHSQNRCETLVNWTQAELEETRQAKRGFLFRFRHCLPDEPAQAAFLSPCWRRAYDAKPLSLLPQQRATRTEARGLKTPFAADVSKGSHSEGARG